MDIIYDKILDLSKHNGDVDFSKVKADGIQGVIIRAGYGNSNIDEKFKQNIESAYMQGLHIGVYWFGYAYSVSQAEKEADFLLNLLDNYKGKIDMPIFYDWEYDSYQYALKNGVTVDKKLCTDMTIAFMDKLESKGYYTGFYANIDYLTNYYEDRIKSRYACWVAQWSNKCTYTNQYGFWQYTSTGKVNGVSGNVDISHCYVDYPKIIKERGFNGYKATSDNAIKITFELDRAEYESFKNTIDKISNSLN